MRVLHVTLNVYLHSRYVMCVDVQLQCIEHEKVYVHIQSLHDCQITPDGCSGRLLGVIS
jgi:hypothetical protein